MVVVEAHSCRARRHGGKMDSLPMSMDRDSLQQLLGEIDTILLDCDGEWSVISAQVPQNGAVKHLSGHATCSIVDCVIRNSWQIIFYT